MKILDNLKANFTKTVDKVSEYYARASAVAKFLGKHQVGVGFNYKSFCNNRTYYLTENMDELIEKLKASFSIEPMLNRVIQNISQKVSNTEYHFISPNSNYRKAELVEKRFKSILRNSYYNDKTFFKEHILNLIKYSNSFSIPYRDPKTNQLKQVLIVQNKGWHVNESFGTSMAKSFIFDDTRTQNKKIYENEVAIWHYKFNKESDEIFGMPLWVSVIPSLNKYSSVLDAAIDSYNDQAIEKTIYQVGVTKNGSSKPILPAQFDQIRSVLSNNPDSDLIVDVPINIERLKKDYTSPDKILDNLELQVIAGLYTAKSQLGGSGAGRQDAETQQQNTDSIIEDFKSSLQNSLNNTIIKEICKDLFGNCEGDNDITLEFDDDFNTRERREKHATYLFQGGVIDLDECRKICKLSRPINLERSFNNIYKKNEMDGTVENSNNPENQFGKTQTTKKTKKD